jgi:hypothetical protein
MSWLEAMNLCQLLAMSALLTWNYVAHKSLGRRVFLAMRKAGHLRREAREALAASKKVAADLVETHNALQASVAHLAKRLEDVNIKAEQAKGLLRGVR